MFQATIIKRVPAGQAWQAIETIVPRRGGLSPNAESPDQAAIDVSNAGPSPLSIRVGYTLTAEGRAIFPKNLGLSAYVVDGEFPVTKSAAFVFPILKVVYRIVIEAKHDGKTPQDVTIGFSAA